MENKKIITKQSNTFLNVKLKSFDKKIDKIEEKIDKILNILEGHKENITNNTYNIEKIKEDLYQNNGKKCIFTRLNNIENEQSNTTKKIAIASGFVSCLSYFFTKIFIK